MRGKERPRLNRKTGGIYTPDQTKASEEDIRWVWRAAGSPRIGDTAGDKPPLELQLIAMAVRPKSHFRKNGELSALGLRHPLPTVKPDFDNAQKIVGDALNGLAYGDDVQFTRALFERRWGEWAGVVIRIRRDPRAE